MTFAGIELDSVLTEAWLTQEKLSKRQELTSTFLRHRKVTLKELHSLKGFTQSTIVNPGQALLPDISGGFCVTSACKFKLNNDPSCPDNKKND